MPLQSTSGAASYDAFGGGVAAVPKYIEDYFSTFLYSGTGSDQTITNNIDLSTKGGLVWLKKRTYPSGSVTSHCLMDTNRGTSAGYISSNSTDAENAFDIVSSFNTNGFDFNTPVNDSGDTYVSWSWAKAPKFFDVVTYTGDGTSSQAIAHNLGSTPGCIIIKPLVDASFNDWRVWHRSLTSQSYQLKLNTTDAEANVGNFIGQNSTTFTVGYTGANQSGIAYVAYLFAHDAGGFGLTGTDNVISCGSYTGNGSTTGPVVTLGYEPQWLLVKRSSTSGDDWILIDNMRGFPVTGNTQYLNPNNALSESSFSLITPTATGFQPRTTDGGVNGNGSTYIYIAIRRGPMKVPTDATKVFAPIARTGTGSSTTQDVGLNGADLAFTIPRTAAGNNWQWVDRLRGGAAGSAARIQSNNTSQEFLDQSMSVLSSTQTTISYGGAGSNGSGVSYIVECFKRAPSFFDEVCYTGTGSATTQAHNLGVVPEMMIVKGRTNAFSWFVYQKDLTTANQSFLTLNSDSAVSTGSAVWNSTSPTSSVFSIGSANAINQSGQTFVAYLFATCAGVSKCFSYTGNGSSQTINCGFTGGARWILIKRTDSTGDWYCWDSARGIVSGNDPHLSLNTTAAEVTSDDTIDTDSTGFVVNQVAATNVNVSSATYIGLAIA